MLVLLEEGLLLYELLDHANVVVLDHLAQVFLDVDSCSVADLVALNADLRLTERKDFYLLEATVDRDACLHAHRVEGQYI